VVWKNCGSSFSWKSTGTNQSSSRRFARAEYASAEGVVLEPALAGEHGVAHAFALGQRLVKGRDEPARGLDQHAVAHGDHGSHADLQQL
jgi:hypothetical protein